MKVRFTAFLTVLAIGIFAGGVSVGTAQVQTGDISGRVADNTGAVLPGVTVTATSPALITPLTAVTSSTGTYQFPRVPIGPYTVRFELPGFSTLVRENVVVTIGFNATINADMQLSSVQETVTVSGESPVVDTRNTTQKSTFDLNAMQNIPSARDPWVMLERSPAIAMDRLNVGGSQSGQQSGYISRGSGSGNNKWSLDGVDITDMSAQIGLDSGPARIAAEHARYDMAAQRVQVGGPILVTAADGYRLETRDVTVDLNDRSLASRGAVDGRMPLGRFRADSLRADLGTRIVVLDGRARLHIVQGAVR